MVNDYLLRSLAYTETNFNQKVKVDHKLYTDQESSNYTFEAIIESNENLIIDYRLEDFESTTTADDFRELSALQEIRINDVRHIEFLAIQGDIQNKDITLKLLKYSEESKAELSQLNVNKEISAFVNIDPKDTTDLTPSLNVYHNLYNIRLFKDALATVKGSLASSQSLNVLSKGLYSSFRSSEIEEGKYELRIHNLPRARGYITFLDESFNHKGTYYIPLPYAGHVSANTLKHNMIVGTIEDLTYGLLESLTKLDQEAMLSQLAAVSSLMQLSGKRGIPNTFYRHTLQAIDENRNIFKNAQLAVVICGVIRELQNRPPQLRVNFDGWFNRIDYLFSSFLELFNESLADDDDWAAEIYNDEIDQFINPSIITSLLVSLAYGDILSIYYDQTSHYKAARLFLTLFQAPFLPTDPLYTYFSDGHKLHQHSVFKIIWLLRHNLSLATLPQFYLSLTTIPFSTSDSEYNYSNLWLEFIIESYKEELTKLTEIELPFRFRESYTESIEDRDWYEELKISALVNSSKRGYKFYKDEVFNNRGIEAEAFVNYVRQGEASLWPTGLRWPDVALDLNTNLGSALNAFAYTLFNCFLTYQINKETNLLKASLVNIEKYGLLQPYQRQYETESYFRVWLWQIINSPKDSYIGVDHLSELYGYKPIALSKLKDFDIASYALTPPSFTLNTLDTLSSLSKLDLLDREEINYAIKPSERYYQYKEVFEKMSWYKFDPNNIQKNQPAHLKYWESSYPLALIENFNQLIPLNQVYYNPHPSIGFSYSSDASSQLSLDIVLAQPLNSPYFITPTNFPIIRAGVFGKPSLLTIALINQIAAGVYFKIYYVQDLDYILPYNDFAPANHRSIVSAQASILNTANVILNYKGTVNANTTNISNATVQTSSSSSSVTTSVELIDFIVPWLFF